MLKVECTWKPSEPKLPTGYVIKTSFENRVSRIGLGSFEDIMKYYII